MSKIRTEKSNIQINNVIYKIERTFSGKKTVKEKIEEMIASKNSN